MRKKRECEEVQSPFATRIKGQGFPDCSQRTHWVIHRYSLIKRKKKAIMGLLVKSGNFLKRVAL